MGNIALWRIAVCVIDRSQSGAPGSSTVTFFRDSVNRLRVLRLILIFLTVTLNVAVPPDCIT